MGLAHRFVVVLCKIDDGELTTRRQGAPGFGNRRLRSWYMMQYHTGNDCVDFPVGDRKMLEVTQTKFTTIHGRFSCRLARQLQHRL
jgi:hypothetical protein